jgi:hypothetical protein
MEACGTASQAQIVVDKSICILRKPAADDRTCAQARRTSSMRDSVHVLHAMPHQEAAI